MLARTPKPHTDGVELCFTGPAEKRAEAEAALRALGFIPAEERLPWRELFPEYDDTPAGSVALRGARRKEGLTQKELATLSGIPQSHISAMENGKMAIGKERAKRLAKALKVEWRMLV